MDWKLTDRALKVKKIIENDEELDAAEFGCGDCFWYAITSGGYFKPETALADQEQIAKVKEAVALLEDLERNVYDKLNPEW